MIKQEKEEEEMKEEKEKRMIRQRGGRGDERGRWGMTQRDERRKGK